MRPNNLPTFREFIIKKSPTYVIDKQAEPIVKLLGMWAFRHEKFEKTGDEFSVDKGILLQGQVGTGKTEIMRQLGRYLQFLQSPYQYRSSVVWHYSGRYESDGMDAFLPVRNGNHFFDELCMLDEKTKVPNREIAVHYGNKILVGQELIMMRETEFKNRGLQTSFTTNATTDELRDTYGARAFSRLQYMCNFIPYTGADRRPGLRPSFYMNENNYQPAQADVPKEEDARDFETENMLNNAYEHFLSSGRYSEVKWWMFERLMQLGVKCATDEELRMMQFDCREERIAQINGSRSKDQQEARRWRILRQQYQDNTIDKEESLHLLQMAKIRAVQFYFAKLKAAGETKIFKPA